MLECFSKIKDISVVELINYNGIFLKRNVFVIDIYRSPIEHKISTFFENISSFHFNTTNELLNNYDLTRIIKRFNLIFPYIAVGDIFIDKYSRKISTKNIGMSFRFFERFIQNFLDNIMNIITQKSNNYGDSTYAYHNHKKNILKEKKISEKN